MQTKKINLGLIVFCIFLSVFVLVLTFTTYATSEPTAVYTVYLDGKSKVVFLQKKVLMIM